MNSGKNVAGSRAVHDLLAGMTLDSVRAYSVVLLVGLHRAPADQWRGEGIAVTEAWVSVSGALRVMNSEHERPGSMQAADGDCFFDARAAALGKLYRLIGEKVEAASVDGAGALTIDFQSARVKAESDGNDLEEVWAVMSGKPEPLAEHLWYVGSDAVGQVSVRRPLSPEGARNS